VQWASLRQAVVWVALKLPPSEARFETLEGYPGTVEYQIETFGTISSEDQDAIEQGKYMVARALMFGNLRARGRAGIEASGSTPVYYADYNAVLDYCRCCERDTDYTEVPKEFWQVDRIRWDDSEVRYQTYREADDDEPVVQEYVDVRIATADLFRVFPDDRQAPPGAKQAAQGKRGPKVKYDVADFFIICALEADLCNLAITQADFVRRMADLLSILWGEDHSPGPTWLKARFAEVQNRRADYDRCRRQLEGKENSD
jgi:hypothetical protein